MVFSPPGRVEVVVCEIGYTATGDWASKVDFLSQTSSDFNWDAWARSPHARFLYESTYFVFESILGHNFVAPALAI